MSELEDLDQVCSESTLECHGSLRAWLQALEEELVFEGTEYRVLEDQIDCLIFPTGYEWPVVYFESSLGSWWHRKRLRRDLDVLVLACELSSWNSNLYIGWVLNADGLAYRLSNLTCKLDSSDEIRLLDGNIDLVESVFTGLVSLECHLEDILASPEAQEV